MYEVSFFNKYFSAYFSIKAVHGRKYLSPSITLVLFEEYIKTNWYCI